MKLVGYADRLSVEPGEDITFMVSSDFPNYAADVVRLIHGDARPEGPGFKSELVVNEISGTHPGKVQHLRPGSYARVPDRGTLDFGPDFTIQMWAMPTTPARGTQTLFSQSNAPAGGVTLRLEDACLELAVGDQGIRTQQPLDAGVWYFIAASVSSTTGSLALAVHQTNGIIVRPAENVATEVSGMPSSTGGDILLATEVSPEGRLCHFFNGKLDSPKIFGRVLGGTELAALAADQPDQVVASLTASWDFSVDISSLTISDVSGHDHHGEIVNRPARAVTGRNWDATTTSWPDAPAQYGAIHFHDDDLSDAGWSPAFTWTVPETLASGVYAVHLTHDEEEDFISFVVAPRMGRPTADIALVLPTFSYLAYANEQMAHEGTLKGLVEKYPRLPEDHYIVDNNLISLYDKHSDDSSNSYASWLRPLVNMRPKYTQHWLDGGKGSPHQFPADLHIVDWLVEQGYSFDVITDLELHNDGVERLAPYSAVLTGTHAEYTSGAMLDTYQGYLNQGGRLLYLSGNGMFWVTEPDAATASGIEIRRRSAPTWTWPAAPGEAHLSSTGELGGLWSNRGRDAQTWLGVGDIGEGGGPGRPYRRTPDSHDPRVAFVFEGIADNELIGDIPCLVNSWGAAGFELDYSNARMAPAHALVVATADGFGPDYEVHSNILVGGAAHFPDLHADLVFLEYPHDGAVFSFSSISWGACLSYNGYDNNVSRLTRNVLDGFLATSPPWRANS